MFETCAKARTKDWGLCVEVARELGYTALGLAPGDTL